MIKRIAFGTSALFIIVIFLALVAPLFISGETYKAQIKTAVEAATGRVLNIEGKLSVQFFPTAGISAEKVTLSNPKDFDDAKPFMSLSALNIEVATLPLLNGNIEIKNFVLQDPLINMQARQDGKKNWVFNTKVKATPDENTNDASPPSKPVITNPKILPNSLMLRNFEIKNGTILYSKGCCKTVFELKKLNTTVVLQSTASAAAIDGNAEWNGKKIVVKGGIGTLESLINEQKMEVKLSLKNDLFSLSVDGNYEKGGFIGKEISEIGSIKELMKWIAPAAPVETNAKLAFKSESELRCGAAYCSLPNLAFSLDSLNAKGNIKAQFSDIKPMIDINLSTELLDLNPFLPQPAAKNASQSLIVSDAVAQTQERWSDEPIDLSSLNSVNATVIINAQNITFHKLLIDKMVLNSKLQQGQLVIDVNNAVLYKGTGTLLAKINANMVPAAFESGLVLKTIDLEALLKDLASKDDLSGYGDFQLNLKSSGRSVKSMVDALAGEGQLRIAKGEIKRMNLTDMLYNVAGSFNGNGESQSSTYFTELSASYNIAQGVITNHDLIMQVKDLNVSGDGTVSLPAYSINYHLVPKILRTTQDANGVTTVKQGLAVPLIIEGSLDNPKFRPDLAAAAQQALQDPKQLKEQLKNSREVLKEQIKDPKQAVKNLKGLLQGFGGR